VADKNEAMRRVGMFSLMIVGIVLGCGGSQAPAQSPPGDTHASGEDVDDVPAGMGEEGAEPAQETAPAAPQSPVTFRVVNRASEDLVFSIEKGWQTSFIAFSGKPPNAKPIVMFPKFCTASCDVAAEEVCPVCEAPEKVNDVKAAEQRQVVASGASLDVPWDGQVFVYEKTRGARRNQRCECYRAQEVPPETYTVKVCGLRLTKTSTKSTKLQCVESTMTVPSEEPQVITVEFPAP
jgi:hypothetical protein